MSNNDSITTSEIKQDIEDTQKEIDGYQDEKDVLMRNSQQNKVRIYMLEGRISHRESFIKQLNKNIEERK